ncbi:hypothetical protein TTHERM_000185789 (macronuclear) [Tetrahymena thermophila SB210]|uniref:Transmembrane protein n=1 Tax=Tetrahymena thermophila (strain SB210) TaxID=312017 RepID=W7XGR6_TETTS|nr:hypothetical protein TTHERM_000185789 [Tetrahymena thermophila SB210]EWS76233.1 hypothetical protein TTHERM_000185789 [Tetrahymena thermophila SB210]|eukprot:XP_012651280.1 hypothetical protein TTHERM_000185789 [Tetrahymena thermophila SB210]
MKIIVIQVILVWLQQAQIDIQCYIAQQKRVFSLKNNSEQTFQDNLVQKQHRNLNNIVKILVIHNTFKVQWKQQTNNQSYYQVNAYMRYLLLRVQVIVLYLSNKGKIHQREHKTPHLLQKFSQKFFLNANKLAKWMKALLYLLKKLKKEKERLRVNKKIKLFEISD